MTLSNCDMLSTFEVFVNLTFSREKKTSGVDSRKIIENAKNCGCLSKKCFFVDNEYLQLLD